MSEIEVQDLNQFAVYWPPIEGPEGYNESGEPIYGPPQELRVRWEKTNEVFKPSPLSTPIAVVGKLHVDREVADGGQYWEGKLCDLPDNEDQFKNLHYGVFRDSIPDLDGLKFQRNVLLSRQKL